MCHLIQNTIQAQSLSHKTYSTWLQRSSCLIWLVRVARAMRFVILSVSNLKNKCKQLVNLEWGRRTDERQDNSGSISHACCGPTWAYLREFGVASSSKNRVLRTQGIRSEWNKTSNLTNVFSYFWLVPVLLQNCFNLIKRHQTIFPSMPNTPKVSRFVLFTFFLVACYALIKHWFSNYTSLTGRNFYFFLIFRRNCALLITWYALRRLTTVSSTFDLLNFAWPVLQIFISCCPALQ